MSPGGPLPGLDTGLLLPMAITLMAMAAALIVGALVAQLLRHAEAGYRLLPVLLSPAEARLAASLTARLVISRSDSPTIVLEPMTRACDP